MAVIKHHLGLPPYTTNYERVIRLDPISTEIAEINSLLERFDNLITLARRRKIEALNEGDADLADVHEQRINELVEKMYRLAARAKSLMSYRK